MLTPQEKNLNPRDTNEVHPYIPTQKELIRHKSFLNNLCTSSINFSYKSPMIIRTTKENGKKKEEITTIDGGEYHHVLRPIPSWLEENSTRGGGS